MIKALLVGAAIGTGALVPVHNVSTEPKPCHIPAEVQIICKVRPWNSGGGVLLRCINRRGQEFSVYGPKGIS